MAIEQAASIAERGRAANSRRAHPRVGASIRFSSRSAYRRAGRRASESSYAAVGSLATDDAPSASYGVGVGARLKSDALPPPVRGNARRALIVKRAGTGGNRTVTTTEPPARAGAIDRDDSAICSPPDEPCTQSSITARARAPKTASWIAALLPVGLGCASPGLAAQPDLRCAPRSLRDRVTAIGRQSATRPKHRHDH